METLVDKLFKTFLFPSINQHLTFSSNILSFPSILCPLFLSLFCHPLLLYLSWQIFNHSGSKTSKYAPKEGNRYHGIYKVTGLKRGRVDMSCGNTSYAGMMRWVWYVCQFVCCHLVPPAILPICLLIYDMIYLLCRMKMLLDVVCVFDA